MAEMVCDYAIKVKHLLNNNKYKLKKSKIFFVAIICLLHKMMTFSVFADNIKSLSFDFCHSSTTTFLYDTRDFPDNAVVCSSCLFQCPEGHGR